MAQMPANIRISAQFPFPATVQGAAPIVITKQNGVWTVSFSITSLGVATPPLGNYPTDFLLVYDSLAKTYFQMPISAIAGIIASARTQRLVTATPIVIGGADQILNCNIAVNATCALPASATRGGNPLTFKDLGQATNHPITITPNGIETIDGQANFIINVNRQGLTLVPFNDGTNSGWMIQ